MNVVVQNIHPDPDDEVNITEHIVFEMLYSFCKTYFEYFEQKVIEIGDFISYTELKALHDALQMAKKYLNINELKVEEIDQESLQKEGERHEAQLDQNLQFFALEEAEEVPT